MVSQTITIAFAGKRLFHRGGRFRLQVVKRLLTAGLLLVWAALGLAQPGGPLVGLATSIERRLCVTDSTPVQIQSVVWNDLLDKYACPWAEGESGATNVRQRLLENLHFSGRWVYDPSSPANYVFQTPQNMSVNLFYLSDLLGESHILWPNGQSGRMDCQDFAFFLALMLYAQGQSVLCKDLGGPEFLTVTGIQQSNIRTNPLCPAGWDPTLLLNYRTYNFEFHVFLTSGLDVIDASVSHWTDWGGATYRNPVSGWLIGSWVQSWNGPNQVYGLVRGFEINALVFDPWQLSLFLVSPFQQTSAYTITQYQLSGVF